MSSASDVAQATHLNSLHSGVDVLVITPGAGALAKPVRAIRVVGSGTLTITTFAGNSRTIYFKDGETRFIGATHVTAASGPTVVEGIV